jgi:hypothetical protein
MNTGFQDPPARLRESSLPAAKKMKLENGIDRSPFSNSLLNSPRLASPDTHQQDSPSLSHCRSSSNSIGPARGVCVSQEEDHRAEHKGN